MASKVREVYLPSDHDDERKSALWLMAFRFAVAVNLIVCISLLPQALSQRSQRLNLPQSDSTDF